MAACQLRHQSARETAYTAAAAATSSTHLLVPYQVLLIIAKSFIVDGDAVGRAVRPSLLVVTDRPSGLRRRRRLFDEESI